MSSLHSDLEMFQIQKQMDSLLKLEQKDLCSLFTYYTFVIIGTVLGYSQDIIMT